jgi:predicted amidohydrolase
VTNRKKTETSDGGINPLAFLLVAAAFACAGPVQAAPPDRPLIGVSYFSGWWRPLPNKWNYDPALGDWRARFPERVPLLGEHNGQPTMDKEIVAASEHGVDFFLILWYYNGPGESQEREKHARFLNEGVKTFVKSPEAHRMRFAIEYCNHQPYQVKSAEDWNHCVKAWTAAMRQRLENLGFPLPDGLRQKALTIYAWNEFGEGGFLAPTRGEGYMKLGAIQEVFGRLRIAGIVLKWIRGDKEANFHRAEPMIRKAAAGGAQIVCTTECFLDGYAIADKSIPLEAYRSLGEPIPEGAYFKRLAALARELKIVLVAGMLETDGDARFNTAVLISPKGDLLGKYRKQHLEHELVRNRPGTVSPVFETPYGRVGLLICADRRVPEIAQRMKQGGADFLLCPSGGMFGAKSNDWILQARSRETGLPIVFVHPAEFLVTGPDGSVLEQATVGDVLLIPPADAGTAKDASRVFYFDLPAIGPKARNAEPSLGSRGHERTSHNHGSQDHHR